MSDERLNRQPDPARVEKAMVDRPVTENRELSDADRIALFQGKLYQDVLPDLPNDPEWHYVWLSRNNPRDIEWRLRMGWMIVKPEDVPHWAHASANSAAVPGQITVNEMVAARLPMRLHNEFLRINHSIRPAQQEEGLKRMREALAQQAGAGRVEDLTSP